MKEQRNFSPLDVFYSLTNFENTPIWYQEYAEWRDTLYQIEWIDDHEERVCLQEQLFTKWQGLW